MIWNKIQHKELISVEEKFMGAHNFYNYSKNIKAKDQHAKIYVI